MSSSANHIWRCWMNRLNGPYNDTAILHTAKLADLVICGWGSHANKLQGRGTAILAMLKSAGIQPHCYRLNDDGSPQHPLYIPYSAQPQPF